MGNEMQFLRLGEIDSEKTLPVLPAIANTKETPLGINAKVCLLVLTMAIVAGVLCSRWSKRDSSVSLLSSSSGDTNAGGSKLFRSPDAALRDSVNGSPAVAPATTGADTWAPPTTEQIVVVNGQRGVYDARGNFFPIVEDAYNR